MSKRSSGQPTRRHFLRGAGVALAIPWLEAIPLLAQEAGPATRAAASAVGKPPLRFGAIFYSNGWLLYYGDAEAHLNIARRMVDSRTPGYDQVGTVWLPLPHWLMLPFVRVDWMWLTGVAGAIPSQQCSSIHSPQKNPGRTITEWCRSDYSLVLLPRGGLLQLLDPFPLPMTQEPSSACMHLPAGKKVHLCAPTVQQQASVIVVERIPASCAAPMMSMTSAAISGEKSFSVLV